MSDCKKCDEVNEDNPHIDDWDLCPQCLYNKYIQSLNQPERSKREDSFEKLCEWGSNGKFGLITEEEMQEMRCSEH